MQSSHWKIWEKVPFSGFRLVEEGDHEIALSITLDMPVYQQSDDWIYGGQLENVDHSKFWSKNFTIIGILSVIIRRWWTNDMDLSKGSHIKLN